MILLCEDGSLRIYMANVENTSYWLQPSLQPSSVISIMKPVRKRKAAAISKGSSVTFVTNGGVEIDPHYLNTYSTQSDNDLAKGVKCFHRFIQRNFPNGESCLSDFLPQLCLFRTSFVTKIPFPFQQLAHPAR